MIKVTVKGLDQIQQKFEEIKEKAESIHGQQVPLTELLTDYFMLRFTDFNTAVEMFEKSGFKVETPEDFKNIPDTDWDNFIAEHTHFSDWHEMLSEASAEYAANLLGFKED